MLRTYTLRKTAPFFFSIALLWTSALFAVSPTISYQGRLTDSLNIPVADSSYSVLFALFADSVGGTSLWEETATVNTHDGLFTHLLGENTPLPLSLFQNNSRLFLEITVSGETVLPRTKLSYAPYALSAAGLSVTDGNDSPAVKTYADSHQISVFDYSGAEDIRLRGGIGGDEAVILPDSSVNADEMLNEPGIAVSVSPALKTLITDEMTDLITIKITIPTDGYIVVHGKCYLLLSGTTGPNRALVQIDENEGGPSNYPYYVLAGLSGYVNTGINYFPVYVTRTYHKSAGTYTFRMEGRAENPTPALAQSWDHIITAVFYPTEYEAVNAVVPTPEGDPDAVPLHNAHPDFPDREGTFYKVDLRHHKNK